MTGSAAFTTHTAVSGMTVYGLLLICKQTVFWFFRIDCARIFGLDKLACVDAGP